MDWGPRKPCVEEGRAEEGFGERVVGGRVAGPLVPTGFMDPIKRDPWSEIPQMQELMPNNPK